MTDAWFAAAILPNLSVIEAIEEDTAALVPGKDARLREDLKIRAFLGSFRDPFGGMIKPSVLAVRDDAPESVKKWGAVAAFRDSIAISVLPLHRATNLAGGIGDILYSDFFGVYPWMPTRSADTGFGARTAAFEAYSWDRPKPQARPEVPVKELRSSGVDWPLLKALLARWKRCFDVHDEQRDWGDRALFRSLNMAKYAASVPGSTDVLLYDYGRCVALWVSAFEILLHDGSKRQVSKDHVLGCLASSSWHDRRLSLQTLEAPRRKGSKSVCLLEWLCRSLYEVRNDFLHGNPIRRADFGVGTSGRTLYEYAPLVFRVLLSAKLGIQRSHPAAALSPTEWVDCLLDRLDDIAQAYERAFVRAYDALAQPADE